MSGFDVLGPIGGEGGDPRRVLGGNLPGLQEGAGPDAAEKGFGSVLQDALAEVVARNKDVKDKVEQMASGKPVEMHDLMIAMGKSEVTFNLMLEVRNRFLEAWRELSRSVV